MTSNPGNPLSLMTITSSFWLESNKL